MPKRDDSTGLKKRTMPKEGIFNGQTAPLWDNPKPGFFLGLFYQAFTQLFLFQIANAVYISSLEDCQVSVSQLPLLCLTSLLIYGLAALRMFHVKYATDVEWFWYIVRFIVSLIAGMVLCLGALGIIFLNYIYADGDPQNPAPCTGSLIFTSPQTLFIFINVGGVVVIQVQIIFFLLIAYVQFYIMNSETKFAYKSTRQVMLLD